MSENEVIRALREEVEGALGSTDYRNRAMFAGQAAIASAIMYAAEVIVQEMRRQREENDGR